jgi:hypothetical protein
MSLPTSDFGTGSEARKSMKEQVEVLAQRGAPSGSSLVERNRDIIWPTLAARSSPHARLVQPR